MQTASMASARDPVPADGWLLLTLRLRKRLSLIQAESAGDAAAERASDADDEADEPREPGAPDG